MGRSRRTDKAESLKIFLQAYVKIIPCQKIIIETLSKNGNILSTEKKENCNEPIILPISEQEIISDQIKEFTIIEQDSFLVENFFLHKNNVSSKISIKCPYIEKSDNTQSTLDLNKIVENLTEENTNMITPTKTVHADIAIEISEINDKKHRSDQKGYNTATGLPTEVCMNPDKKLVDIDNINPEEHQGKISKETDKPIAVKPVNRSNQTVVDTQSEKDDVINTPVRPRSRRTSCQKLNLALEALKPKTPKKIMKDNNKISLPEDNNKITLPEDSEDAQTVKSFKDSLSPDIVNTANSTNDKSFSQDTASVSSSFDISTSVDHSNNQESSAIPTEILSMEEDSVLTVNFENSQQNVGKEVSEEVMECGDNKSKIRKNDQTSKMILEEDEDAENTNTRENYADDGEDETFSHESFLVGDRKRRVDMKQTSRESEMILDNPSPFRTRDTTCKICKKSFAVGGLTKHMRTHKNSRLDKNERIACSYCNKVFKYQYALDCHIKIHEGQTEDGKFPCEVCKRVYSHKSALFKHRRSGPCSTKHRCDTCGVSFANEKSLQFHINQQHISLPNSHDYLKCPDCGKNFVTPGGLKKHKRLNKCKLDLECKLCKKSFTKSLFFERHMLKHNELKPETYQCELCGAFLGSKYSLLKHVSRHKSVKSHKCPQCEKCFFDPSSLKVHLRTHNNERPYICDTCGRSFSQTGHLYRHKLQAHKIGKYPFECTICGKGFVDRRNIDYHYQSHEKRNLREANKKAKAKAKKEINKIEPVEPLNESNVIHIESEYDISDLLNGHITQTNGDGSQTVISSNHLQSSIEQILHAANENSSTIEYTSTEDGDGAQVYDEQTIINIGDLKVENALTGNIVYTLEDNIGAVESIPASDLGILAETAQQFQDTEGVTYYIIKKEL